jgi:hypothetical protein
MKRTATAIVLVLTLAAVLVEAYPWLSRKYWHWKHQHVLIVKGYRVRIPERYQVTELEANSALVVDTNPPRQFRRMIWPQIIFLPRLADPGLRVDSELQKRVQTREIPLPVSTIAGEKTRCYRDEIPVIPTEKPGAITGGCVTEGGLEMLFSGMNEDLPDLMEVLSNATKSN